jgi:hypothetical protein
MPDQGTAQPPADKKAPASVNPAMTTTREHRLRQDLRRVQKELAGVPNITMAEKEYLRQALRFYRLTFTIPLSRPHKFQLEQVLLRLRETTQSFDNLTLKADKEQVYMLLQRSFKADGVRGNPDRNTYQKTCETDARDNVDGTLRDGWTGSSRGEGRDREAD